MSNIRFDHSASLSWWGISWGWNHSTIWL